MSIELSAIIFFENGWQVAQCVELELASQGNTEEEAFLNLQEASRLYFQNPRPVESKSFANSIEIAKSLLPEGIVRTWSLE
jgi:predicted RNase H-like HicB family nuclease